MDNKVARLLRSFSGITHTLVSIVSLLLSLTASAQFTSEIEQILTDDAISYQDKAGHLEGLGTDAVPSMLQYLETNSHSRFHIVPALGELEDSRAVAPILQMLEVPGNEWMVSSLAKIGGPKAEAGILAVMHSDDIRLMERYVAAEAIARFGTDVSKSEVAAFLLDETYLAAMQKRVQGVENHGTRFFGKEWWSALRVLGTKEATEMLVKWFDIAPMPYDKEQLIKVFVEIEEPSRSVVDALLEYALNGEVGDMYLRVSALEALTGYRDAVPNETILSAFDSLQAESELHGLSVPLQRLKDIRSNLDARYARGFVSRDQIRGEESEGSNRPEVQPPDSATNTPSVRAASNEELDEPTTATEAAASKEPDDSGWPGGILLISIGAVAFLLALAGYRVFSKKGRSES